MLVAPVGAGSLVLPGTRHTRAAVPIVRALLQEGCRVHIYDPVARERGQNAFAADRSVTFAATAYEAASDADALIVLTDWPEFSKLDLDAIREALKYHLIVDGRNMYDPEEVTAKGLAYVSMGRPDAFPENHPVTCGANQSRRNQALRVAVG